jgi:hypothetical protein
LEIKDNKITAKQRYFKRVYDDAPIIECACGCGGELKSKDHYGRDKKYINGHNGRKYIDPTQYKREWNHRNRIHRQKYKMEFVHKRRGKLIELAGGKCSNCGLEYNGKNAPIFDFHHRDPNTKDFNINDNSLNRFSLEKALSEVKKCDLLCSNCHRLYHWVD